MRHLRTVLAIGVAVLLPTEAAAQVRTMAGRVTDSRTGEPVSEGSVEIRSLGVRSPLQPDGVFVLHIPLDVVAEVTLTAAAVGYRTATVTASPYQETVFIRLEPDVLKLEAVVVSGQATEVARDHGATAPGAVSVDLESQSPPAGVSEVMQSRVPGVDVRQNSGVPGGDLMVVLRGVTTILGPASPLYVLDGVIVSAAAVPGGVGAVTGGQIPVPSRIADLNPHDIESIEILRGGAATTMYGSRGANGVVIIRTKRGR